ncbi:MAG: gliding motility-associated C-terminal domain-containing protein [Bacteroidia bacterium]
MLQRIFYTLLFASSFIKAQAQVNLVPNGSFEIYTSCPSLAGQINRLANWYDPTQASSDFLSTCATNTIVAVPNNFVGTQSALNGNNYAGFGIFPWTWGTNNNVLCEYVQVQLNQPLLAGTSYYTCFFVSLADSSEYYTTQIAASFGDTAIHTNNNFYNINLPRHVNANYPLNNVNAWQKVEGYYTAHGGEQYLTIGYFRDSLMPIDTIRYQNINPNGICDTGSYYYLDSVFVIDSVSHVGMQEINQSENNSQNYLFNYSQGSNPELLIFDNKEKMSLKLRILNLLGEVIWDERQKNKVSWWGKNKNNEPCQSGTYIYLIENNDKIIRNGYIQLINTN